MKDELSCQPPCAYLVEADHSPAISRAALVAVAFGSLMVALDVTALNVALTGIGRAFAVGIDRLQWIANAYTLVFASLLLSTGAASDRFGARRTYMSGLIVFMAASIACAAAPSVAALIAARALQGLGAAMMLPSSMALLAAAYPETDRRARAIALWGGISAAGLVAGPVVGGLLCELAGWRAIFYLNALVCLLAMGAAARSGVPSVRLKGGFDPWAASMSAIALGAVTFVLIEIPVLGWRAPIIEATLACGVACICGLVIRQKIAIAPMLPPKLLQSPDFGASVGVAFLQTFAYFGALFVVPLALQVNGGEPLTVGLQLAPMTIVTGVVATCSGWLAGAFSTRIVMTLGLLAGALGASLACVLGVGPVPFMLAAPLLGMGGAMLPLIVSAALAGVTPQHTGIASGVINTARQSGGVLGVACLGALMNAGRSDARWALLLIAVAFCGAALLGFAQLQRSAGATVIADE